jgi:hypothetical protein
MNYSRLLALSVMAALLATVSTKALTAEEVARLQNQLNSTPPPELPAVAAAALSRAKAPDKDHVATTIIHTIAAKRPSSLPAVVHSMAAAASPSQVASIKAAAVTASPAQADEINGAGGNPTPAANRPPVTPGNVNGNRPTTPPGLAKKQYGSP